MTPNNVKSSLEIGSLSHLVGVAGYDRMMVQKLRRKWFHSMHSYNWTIQWYSKILN